MTKSYWLCKDAQGFMACANCLRNPEHETNAAARIERTQKWDRPLTSRTGCADQMMPTAGVGSARGKAGA